MKKRLWIAIAAVLLIFGFALYWNRAAKRSLNIDPQALHEIEKAKRR